MALCWLALEKVYDNVNQEMLWNVLEKNRGETWLIIKIDAYVCTVRHV